jgi:hypothetical protein
MGRKTTMNHGRLRALTLGLAAMAALQFQANTADAMAPAVNPRDWTGVWVLEGSFMDKQDGTVIEAPRPPRRRADGTRIGPTLKGVYAKAQAEAAAASAKGIQIGDTTASCMPQGMPTFWGGPFAFEIMQTPKQINFFQEWNEQTRRVYLDGRPHPDDLDPAFNGHSIGHWDGDTLVVDTIGFRDQVYVAMADSGHSDQMHIVERIRLVEPDVLEVALAITDEVAFEGPSSRILRLKRRANMEIQEYVCAENNRNTPDDSGTTTVILSGDR